MPKEVTKDVAIETPPSPADDVIVLSSDDEEGGEESSPAVDKVCKDVMAPPTCGDNNDKDDNLPSGWKRYPTKKRDKIKHPEAPDYYYFNSITKNRSWYPPRPLFPGEEGAAARPTVANPSKKGVNRYFHGRCAPAVSPQHRLQILWL